MPQTMTSRLVFFEILEGDRAKLRARSNLTPSGGGARDLRFPYEPFRHIMERLFPHEEPRATSRAAPGAQPDPVTGRKPRTPTTLTIRTGDLTWHANGDTRMAKVECWPPTGARPSEGRLARIHSLEPLRDGVLPAGQGKVFLILVQDNNGVVMPSYVPETYLRSPACDRAVSEPILACVERAKEAEMAGRSPDRIQGYVDYSSPEGTRRYCHG